MYPTTTTIFRHGGRLGILAAVVIAALTGAASAHDTDQFSLPVGQEFADLGDFLNQQVVDGLQKAVDDLNRRMRSVLERDLRSIDPGSRPPMGQTYDPEGVLERCHSKLGVARAVYDAYGPALTRIEGLEHDLFSSQMQARYPGKITAYNPKAKFKSIYNKAYFILDPRNVTTAIHSSSIKVYGVYLGTDKIGHFSDMGYHYYKAYMSALARGADEQQAMAQAVKLGTDGIISEWALLGVLTAGSYSNADLISNYVGCLFYRNLTEPTLIKGTLCPPILERDGEYWKLADATLAPHFFKRFISEHWNEALNPSLYEPLMRDTVRKLIRERNSELLAWYKDLYGDEDPTIFFDRLAHTLSTYYGEPYGHSGQFEHLIHLGNTIHHDQQ
ncbi:MAG: hypothetical protein IT445_10395 [Phycisphaeraceae bacterium]|nr:hypothetical protein [Phycisphaeraceae bacterium]